MGGDGSVATTGASVSIEELLASFETSGAGKESELRPLPLTFPLPFSMLLSLSIPILLTLPSPLRLAALASAFNTANSSASAFAILARSFSALSGSISGGKPARRPERKSNFEDGELSDDDGDDEDESVGNTFVSRAMEGSSDEVVFSRPSLLVAPLSSLVF